GDVQRGLSPSAFGRQAIWPLRPQLPALGSITREEVIASFNHPELHHTADHSSPRSEPPQATQPGFRSPAATDRRSASAVARVHSSTMHHQRTLSPDPHLYRGCDSITTPRRPVKAAVYLPQPPVSSSPFTVG
ncbi:hypothetical protein Dimus_031902, partial [Dionaea muscipula]